MPYAGYTSEEICKKLRRHRQVLYASGLLGRISKSYPFGQSRRSLPLYDVEEVDRLAQRMIRFDAAVARREIGKRTPLVQVFDPRWEDASLDVPCPRCSGPAVLHPEDRKRLWCPVCGDLVYRRAGRDKKGNKREEKVK